MAYFQGESDRPNLHHTSITVGTEGDGYHDTFFPVWWWGSPSSWGHRRIIISRAYSASGPSVHGTHKAGLQFEAVCGNNDWGGHPHSYSMTHHSYTYRQTVANFGGTAHNMKNFVLLRAGGYTYNITTEGFEPDLVIGNHTTGQYTYSGTSLDATTTTTISTKAYP
jgi:hypothetical protein